MSFLEYLEIFGYTCMLISSLLAVFGPYVIYFISEKFS